MDVNGCPLHDVTSEHAERAKPRLVQVGWISRTTGVICDCPVYETSPHANYDPVYKEER